MSFLRVFSNWAYSVQIREWATNASELNQVVSPPFASVSNKPFVSFILASITY